jgi:uncharacterized membrane protein (TIGR02234 family)
MTGTGGGPTGGRLPAEAGRAAVPATAAAGAARRSLTAWAVICVLAGGLALLAAGRTWATVTFDAQAGPLAAGKVSLSGGELAAWLTPAVLAALAAGAAVLATRGVARRLVGLVISLCGAAAMAGAWSGTRAETIAGTAREHAATAMIPQGGAAAAQSVVWAWPLAAAVGGFVLVAAGVAAAVMGGRWPAMSSRYDRPGRAGRTGPGSGRVPDRRSGDRALWDALDEGEDPTADPT